MDSGRAVVNDVEPEGFCAGAASNTSDTTVAELFLEVIVRHVPGRMAGKNQRAITEWEFATLLCVLVRDDRVEPLFSGKTWPDSDESAVRREPLDE